MEKLAALLSLIPGAFWIAVAGSLFTLAGVYISNAGNNKRLRTQLEHDSLEKARERTASLRRETYLKAAEELARVGIYIGSLAQIDITKANPAIGLQDFSAAAARLQLVAEPETAMLANKLAGAYSQLIVRLVPKLVPLGIARAAIATHDELYNHANSEAKRVLSEMTKFNEAASANQQVFAALQRSFEGFQKQADEQSNERTNAWQIFNTLTLEFSEKLVEEQSAILKMQIPLLVSIRNDLGLCNDIKSFENQVTDQWIQLTSEMKKSLTLLKEANPAFQRTASGGR